MSVSFKLTPDGDLDLTGGKITLVDDTAQRLATRLRMLLGEWFLDLTDGTPYLKAGVGSEPILGSHTDIAHVRSALIDRIVNTEGVVSLRSLDLNFDPVRRRCGVRVVALGPKGAAIEVVL